MVLPSFAFNGAKASIYVSEVTEQAPLNLGINRTFFTRPPANLSFKALVTALMSPYWSVDSQGCSSSRDWSSSWRSYFLGQF